MGSPVPDYRAVFYVPFFLWDAGAFPKKAALHLFLSVSLVLQTAGIP